MGSPTSSPVDRLDRLDHPDLAAATARRPTARPPSAGLDHDPATTRRRRRPHPIWAAGLLTLGCLQPWSPASDQGGDVADGLDTGVPPLPPTSAGAPDDAGSWTGDAEAGGGDTANSSAGDGSGDGSGDDAGDGDSGALPDVGDDGGAAGDGSDRGLRLWQILADPAGKDGDPAAPEIVEIHNPGPGAASILGVTLRATSWPDLQLDSLVGITSIYSGESLVIYRFSSESPVPTLAVPGVTVRLVGSAGLRNADGHVALLDAGGELIDLAVYGAPSGDPVAAAWTGEVLPDPGADDGFCRRGGQPTGPLSSFGAASWELCAPAPGGLGSGPPESWQIVELRPGTGPSIGAIQSNEFIELINTTSSSLSLDGWRLRIGNAEDELVWIGGALPCAPGPCVPPGGRALLVHDLFDGETGDAALLVPADGQLGDLHLGPGSSVALITPGGEVASTARDWADPSGPPSPSESSPALHRVTDAAPDVPESWIAGAPTPGGR